MLSGDIDSFLARAALRKRHAGRCLKSVHAKPLIRHIFAYTLSKVRVPDLYMHAGTVEGIWRRIYTRTVLSIHSGHGRARCVLLKAKVNPSQRSPDNAHEAWIVARAVPACTGYYLDFLIKYYIGEDVPIFYPRPVGAEFIVLR